MSRITDNHVTDEYLYKLLHEIAEDEAKEGEFHPAEHICYTAAERLKELYNMVHGEDDIEMLYEIVKRVRDKAYLERLMKEAEDEGIK